MRIAANGERVYDEDGRPNYRIFAQAVAGTVSGFYGSHAKENNIEFWSFLSQLIADSTKSLMIRHEASFMGNANDNESSEYNTTIEQKRRYAKLALRSAQKAIDGKVADAEVDYAIAYHSNNKRERQFKTTLRNYYFVVDHMTDSSGRSTKDMLMDALRADERFLFEGKH